MKDGVANGPAGHEGWDPLTDPALIALYRRGLHLPRHGFSPVAIRTAVVAQAVSEGLTDEQGLDVALRILNAPEADPFNAIVCAAAPGDRFLAEAIEKPISLIGNGLLFAGDVGVWYGKPGLNKSWLFAVLAACGVGGRLFLGLSVAQVRVGLISLEGHDFFLQERLRIALREIYGEEWLEHAGNFSVLTRRRLGRRLGLLEDLPGLRRWADGEGFGLILPDPLSKLHQRRETAEDIGPVIDAAEELAADGDPQRGVLIAHHERKLQGNAKEDDDLDALRGTSRLSTDPRFLMRVKRHPADRQLRVLVVTKASYGAIPDPIYVRVREEDGYPMLGEKPAAEKKADQRREAIRRALEGAGAFGCTRAELEKVAELKERAVLDHLKAIGAVMGAGNGPNTRWYVPEHRPQATQERVL